VVEIADGFEVAGEAETGEAAVEVWAAEPAGSQKVKGRTEPVEIYRLVPR
jgi:class 3 adenylate cyclase